MSTQRCTVPECANRQLARGYCHHHYDLLGRLTPPRPPPPRTPTTRHEAIEALRVRGATLGEFALTSRLSPQRIAQILRRGEAA